MVTKFSIHGRAHTRVFTYTEDGVHHEFTAPGGAALVARIFSAHGLADDVTPDDAYLREHMELARYEDKQNKRSYYAVARRAGVTPGVTDYGTGPAPYALLWGGGFKALPVPVGIPVLWATDTELPKKDQFEEIAAYCFLMLDADALRAAGALISRQISWERTATELVWQLQNNPAISYLLRARKILVTFAEDGAVYLERGDGGVLTASLTLANGSGEGFSRGQLQGEIDGAFAAMTAAAALQFEDVMTGEGALRVLPILRSAAAIMCSGYSLDRLKNSDFYLADTEEFGEDAAFEIPIKPGQTAADPDGWCIANHVGSVFEIAQEYVKEGEAAITGLPKLTFGGLTTVDRWEIEAFGNIRNLIVGYAGGDSVRPLSIAVFGSPGSGKSFGVTQIAKNVLPGKIEKLEFNVSQFMGFSDLGAAFQKVRDVILDGKLPLVFFDEFDSDRDGLPLGWVKSFLMPMQDGKFRDESGEHPLGKCILVFAGGTKPSFEEFCKPMRSDDSAERQAFKDIKGPDFVSRLRGTINVLGPNPKDENDRNYILRRAILLRSLCERNEQLKRRMGGGASPISPNILWAMLLVPEYKHGARSMEAILDMSRIEGSVWEPVSLPFYSQLSLHVDADAFIGLVLREVILNSYVEQLARAIHEDFVKERVAEGSADHPNAVPWEELSEGFRESNRNVARRIGQKLNSVGYAYDAGDTPFPSVEEFDGATLLLLAQREHLDYMADKFADGWTRGGERDPVKKTNPTLVDWDELPDDEKKKDFAIAENIIPLLKSIGLRVYRTI